MQSSPVKCSDFLSVPISKNDTMCPEIEKELQTVKVAVDLHGVKHGRL